jgi:hypothetical protein
VSEDARREGVLLWKLLPNVTERAGGATNEAWIRNYHGSLPASESDRDRPASAQEGSVIWLEGVSSCHALTHVEPA